MRDEEESRNEPENGSEAHGGDPDEAAEDPGRKGLGGGIRHGLGVLSAFKEAMEETIQDARDRGDLSAERAKEVLHDAMDRARQVAGGAKERFDFVTQQEVEGLRAQVEELKARVRDLTGEEPGDAPGGQASSQEDETQGS